MITRPLPPAIRSLAHLSPGSSSFCDTRPSACLAWHTRTTSNPQCRSFRVSRTLEAEKNHYDVLGVAPDVPKADLKKRFYTLSKETHPDVNPGNPSASRRFSEISEAYATLGNDEKRKVYDRDVMPRFSRTSSASRNMNRSGTYAGSRPATGLSKRRGTFRGPPPSFYSQAGQSANPSPEEQRRREQHAYTRTKAGSFDASQYASPGRWDPTFNPTPVYKTQTAEDLRRNSRRAAEEAAAREAYMAEQGDFWVRFILVSGVVAFGVGVGTLVNRINASPKGGLVRADGSRRVSLAAGR